jgi:hypothetical protein
VRRRGTFILVVASLPLLSCYAEILDVLMPDEAPPNSSFHVSVEVYCFLDAYIHGVFGTCFPDTWLVENAYYWWDEGEDMLIPNQTCTDWLETTHPAPDGYRWKGFLTENRLGGGAEYYAYVEFDVLNDDRLGLFWFEFLVGGIYEDDFYEADYSDRYYITIQDEGGVEVSTWGQLKSMF